MVPSAAHASSDSATTTPMPRPNQPVTVTTRMRSSSFSGPALRDIARLRNNVLVIGSPPGRLRRPTAGACRRRSARTGRGWARRPGVNRYASAAVTAPVATARAIDAPGQACGPAPKARPGSRSGCALRRWARTGWPSATAAPPRSCAPVARRRTNRTGPRVRSTASTTPAGCPGRRATSSRQDVTSAAVVSTAASAVSRVSWTAPSRSSSPASSSRRRTPSRPRGRPPGRRAPVTAVVASALSAPIPASGTPVAVPTAAAAQRASRATAGTGRPSTSAAVSRASGRATRAAASPPPVRARACSSRADRAAARAWTAAGAVVRSAGTRIRRTWRCAAPSAPRSRVSAPAMMDEEYRSGSVSTARTSSADSTTRPPGRVAGSTGPAESRSQRRCPPSSARSRSLDRSTANGARPFTAPPRPRLPGTRPPGGRRAAGGPRRRRPATRPPRRRPARRCTAARCAR